MNHTTRNAGDLARVDRPGRRVRRAAVLTIVLAVTAGCGSPNGDETPTSGTPDSATPAESGQESDSESEGQEDDIVLAMPAEPITLDPCDTQLNDTGYVLIGNVVEALTKIDPATGDPVPSLAEDWSQDSDTEWTFNLRRDVTFSDGTPFNADAVVYSLERVSNPTNDIMESCGNRAYWGDISLESTVIDDYTLQLTTSIPDPVLPLRVALNPISSPTSTPDDDKTNDPVGTGPFVLASRTPTEAIVLERFDDYAGPTPAVRSARYEWRSSPNVRASMVETGEADLAFLIAPQDATGDNVQTFPLGRVGIFRLDTDIPPLDDVRVREALVLSIDRETIVETLMEHTGIFNDQMVGETVSGYIPGYEGPRYDPDRASQLVAEAAADGVPVDTEIQLYTRTDFFPGVEEVVQAMVSNINSAGLNVRQNNMEAAAWTEHNARPFPADRGPRIISSMKSNAAGDASFSFLTYLITGQRHNVLEDDALTALVNEAVSTPIGPERDDLFQEAARRSYEEHFYMLPYADLQGLLTLGPGVSYTANSRTVIAIQLEEITFD